MDKATLLAKVETYLRAKGEAPSRFGRRVLGDPGLVAALRNGRNVKLTTAARILAVVEAEEAAQ